jgi:hypothetical protein
MGNPLGMTLNVMSRPTTECDTKRADHIEVGIAPKNRVTGMNKIKGADDAGKLFCYSGRSRIKHLASTNSSIYTLGKSEPKNTATPFEQLIKKDQFQVILQKKSKVED